jgi:hypothetical protein
MFKKSASHKKHGSPLPVAIFRFFLSLIIFAMLLGGLYSAYRHFSGLDPIKLSPKAVASNFVSKEKALDYILGLFEVTSETASKGIENTQNIATNPSENDSKPAAHPLFQFLIVSDSHNENNLLAKAITQGSTNNNIEFIIGLGDYTEVGTVPELTEAKKVFDGTGIRYFVTSGDHDLWDARDKQKESHENFTSVFGKAYQSFTFSNFSFILLDNSDNYAGLGEEQTAWLMGELEEAKNNPETRGIYVLAHEPFFHPSSDRVMGKVTPGLKQEANELLGLLAQYGVDHIFAGDIHFFTEYQEPSHNIRMTTIGAVASQRNPQASRYAMVTVYDDASVRVEDIEIGI